MKIERFEEIQAWQEARKLVKMVFDTAKESKMLRYDYRFKDQLTSSAEDLFDEF